MDRLAEVVAFRESLVAVHQPRPAGAGAGSAVAAGSFYRLTSVGFWRGRLWALIKWLVTTTGGRVVAAIGAILLAILSGLASGWAEAIFQRTLNGAGSWRRTIARRFDRQPDAAPWQDSHDALAFLLVCLAG